MTRPARSLMFDLALLSFVLAASAPAAPIEVPPTEAPPPTKIPSTFAVEPTAGLIAMYASDAVSGDIITASSSTVLIQTLEN